MEDIGPYVKEEINDFNKNVFYIQITINLMKLRSGQIYHRKSITLTTDIIDRGNNKINIVYNKIKNFLFIWVTTNLDFERSTIDTSNNNRKMYSSFNFNTQLTLEDLTNQTKHVIDQFKQNIPTENFQLINEDILNDPKWQKCVLRYKITLPKTKVSKINSFYSLKF
tara:strand:+ start:19 stop:519 length:501 start_codon:yes stop_codon:yes gene_type:complete